jgi:hypothetical protein
MVCCGVSLLFSAKTFRGWYINGGNGLTRCIYMGSEDANMMNIDNPFEKLAVFVFGFGIGPLATTKAAPLFAQKHSNSVT